MTAPPAAERTVGEAVLHGVVRREPRAPGAARAFSMGKRGLVTFCNSKRWTKEAAEALARARPRRSRAWARGGARGSAGAT